MSKNTKWRKTTPKPVVQLEDLDIYEKNNFLCTISIKEEYGEFYCYFENAVAKFSLNAYPFESVKQCKVFVEEYLDEIKRIGKELNRTRNRINKFTLMQERGEIPMKED